MAREAKVYRKTSETEISLELNIDVPDGGDVSTTIPFLDHMLRLFARHGFFSLSVKSSGDTDVDYHHLVEDVGICLGQAFKEVTGDKQGINRYGHAVVPMDESLSSVSVDVSGRPYLVFNADFESKNIRDFDPFLFLEFFKAFTDHSGITLHVNLEYGKNSHHKIEAIFKAFAQALAQAVAVNEKVKGIPSTKGVL
ncbi:MAG: imidazoleglycerol-phosphate dehydratase HisB [Syntrophobacterales bacterium]|nr:imidazoleglycerol-phosphate dehydratase HisB [Syntrophobacterales bacterium]